MIKHDDILEQSPRSRNYGLRSNSAISGLLGLGTMESPMGGNFVGMLPFSTTNADQQLMDFAPLMSTKPKTDGSSMPFLELDEVSNIFPSPRPGDYLNSPGRWAATFGGLMSTDSVKSNVFTFPESTTAAAAAAAAVAAESTSLDVVVQEAEKQHRLEEYKKVFMTSSTCVYICTVCVHVHVHVHV